jgi:hypothetical protein
MAAVHVIAPHLFSKRLSSRRRLPLSSLNKSFMATTGNDSDPELSDDTRSLQYAEQDKADALNKKVGKDGHGDYVLRRVSGRTDASDSGSSSCACHDCSSCHITLICNFYSQPVALGQQEKPQIGNSC